MSSYDEVNQKFDKFIQDFDQKINKDTSTLKTIGKSPQPTSESTPSPVEEAAVSEQSSPIKSPLLSTPTKPDRNSISLENQPLNQSSGVNSYESSTPRLNRGRFSTPKSVDTGMKRSNTINSFRSLPKKGLNLNLSINKKTTVGAQKVRSPDTPSIIKEDSGSEYLVHRRRRTNSGVSNLSSEELMGTDNLNDSLRQLALKEMVVVELKDEMKQLQQRIEKEEAELKKLRQSIGNNFKDISPASNPANNRSPSKPNKSVAPLFDKLINDTDASHAPQPQQKNRDSKRDSMWAKPISFLNQFDQILQNEIEKLNKEAFPNSYNNSMRPRSEQQSTTETPLPKTGDTKKSEDVLNTVSTSLWSFVSDVKQGLLGEGESIEEDSRSQNRQQSRKHGTARLNTVENRDINDSIEEDEEEMVTINR